MCCVRACLSLRRAGFNTVTVEYSHTAWGMGCYNRYICSQMSNKLIDMDTTALNPQTTTVSPLPSLPILSPSLHTKYNTLSGAVERRLFKSIYIAVWHYLWPVRRFDEISQAYTLPGALGSLQPTVTVSQWFMLSKLWVLTSAGAVAVNSRNYSFTNTDRNIIAKLQDHALLIRTSFDPAAPYAVKPSHIQRTYISFTPAGVHYFRGVVKECDRLMMYDLYPALGSSKQKAR